MAPNDIYNNKKKYEGLISKIDKITEKPRIGIYYCKNKDNVKYFHKVIKSFEVDDLSWIRRLRLLAILKILTHVVECDLKDINGMEKEDVIIKIRGICKTNTQLKKYEGDIKAIGKKIFSEDEIPKFFREFHMKIDKSREKARDRLEFDEFDKIIKFFAEDIVMQAYLSLSFESLGRPQEILYTKIRDLELNDNYAYLNVSEHGKEGVKKLLSIDSFPYLIRMYNCHAKKRDPNAFLFFNKYGGQLKPKIINVKIKKACRELSVDKHLTCYSLKRAGITYRRLIGESDVTIQHLAGWTSTKQLKIYDQSTQQDTFKLQLIKKGLIKEDKDIVSSSKTKICIHCNEILGFAESICPKCNHILDRDLIKDKIDKDEDVIEFLKQIKYLKENNPDIFNLIKNGEMKKH